jgi:hypothetical protein
VALYWYASFAHFQGNPAEVERLSQSLPTRRIVSRCTHFSQGKS